MVRRLLLKVPLLELGTVSAILSVQVPLADLPLKAEKGFDGAAMRSAL